MQHAELKQIRGIGDATCERLGRDYGIETIADLARLSDSEVDELQRALRASRSNVRNGDVARWRDQARRLASEREAVVNEPLATFVVEARKPVSEPGDQPRFVVHHVEADETLETSPPKPTIDDVIRWMQERVPMPAVLPGTKLPTDREGVVSSSTPDQLTAPSPRPPARRGGLRITGLEIHRADDRVVNGWATSLLGDEPVAIEGGSALVFVGHVSLEGAEEPVTCQMRCRLRRIESDQELSFAWSGEMMATPGMPSAAIPSAPVSIPHGMYRGIFFALDRRHRALRAFCELPLLVVS
jgi:ribosomal protein S13